MGSTVGNQTKKDSEETKTKESINVFTDEKVKLDEKEGPCETETADRNTERMCGLDQQLKNMPSHLSEIDLVAMKIDPKDHAYPFENLVFEGGGSKGLAYCGAVRALEELGLTNQIKRFSGASAGAMCAALMSVGYGSQDMRRFLGLNMSKVCLDAKFGVLSLLPNLLSGYGWNPGLKMYNWMGEVIEKKMGNKDITFGELYKKTGNELCIVVTNLNRMKEEYCHVKTTPDMPIRLAVRMSMSIPGMFQATNYTQNGETNTYVDGGLICNYPLHCFDGWWLSMDSGDSFLEKLQPLDDIPKLLDRRRRFNRAHKDTSKTVGFLLYADSEPDVFRYMLEKRIGVQPDQPPNTKLARMKLEKKRVQQETKTEHNRVMVAVNEFLKVLKKHNLNKDHTISRTELENAFDDDEFSQKSREMLFGKDCTAEKAFDHLDEDNDGEINFNELINFIQSTGVSLQQRFLGYQRTDINDIVEFFDTLQNALLTNIKWAFINDEDLDRTVGINTGYVGTSDFELEDDDKDFVISQGYKSTMTFLKYFAAKSEMSKPSETRHKQDDIKDDVIEEKDDLYAHSNPDALTSINSQIKRCY